MTVCYISAAADWFCDTIVLIVWLHKCGIFAYNLELYSFGKNDELTLFFSQLLHTSLGDIHMRLYPEECPKTVENFTTHCRNGYFDNLIFHRVIKGFMIQTGDPLGDGTGGQSIWGREFEDEFHKR